MTSSRKKLIKRVGHCIVFTFIIYVLISSVLTKVIYDATFTRYDAEKPSFYSDHTQLLAQRKCYEFLNDNALLVGYLYPADSQKLVVLVPGYHASANDYLWQIHHMNQSGLAVFCFDPTGSCESGGTSAVGFPQVTDDLKAALNMILDNDCFGYEQLYLMGHSRGAYGVCSVLGEGYPIKAAVTVSGVNRCMDAILQPVAHKIGALAYTNYPFLWGYQALLFGADTVNCDGAEEIAQSGVPVLVVQGTQDRVYPPHQYSLYDAVKEDNLSNVTYYLCDKAGQNGHTDLLFDAQGRQNQELMNAICEFIKSNERGNE